MTVGRVILLLRAVAILLLVSTASGVAVAQQVTDYIRITPPPGMRWKTLDQSAVTSDITFVDKEGNTWLRKSAAATFASSFVLVQLVGDTGGTDRWMDLVENAPRSLGLRPDTDWSHYREFTTNPRWRGLIVRQWQEATDTASSTGMLMPSWVILPVYRSASNPSQVWSSPDQHQPFPSDPVLSGVFVQADRVRAGTDVPYTVTVQNFATNPPTEVTRPGGYELYRDYYAQFADDGTINLTLAGDFSFQKDYLFPEGSPCSGGLPRSPDGTCDGGGTGNLCPDGLPPLADGTCAPVGPPRPSGQNTTGTPPPGSPALIAPVVAAAPPGPIVPPAPPPDTCAAISGAVLDICGDARIHAGSVATTVPLPPIALHVNPVRGVVHVPDWYWVTGYAGGPQSVTRDYSLPWSLPGTPIVDPVTGQVIGSSPGRSGTYHTSVTVTYRPSRYRWDFGDGTIADTSSLGQPFPAISDVQHSYDLSSLLQPNQMYTYRLIVDWQGDWHVSGDANGSGTVEPRLSIATAQQEMREVQQLRCPDTGCVP